MILFRKQKTPNKRHRYLGYYDTIRLYALEKEANKKQVKFYYCFNLNMEKIMQLIVRLKIDCSIAVNLYILFDCSK